MSWSNRERLQKDFLDKQFLSAMTGNFSELSNVSKCFTLAQMLLPNQSCLSFLQPITKLLNQESQGLLLGVMGLGFKRFWFFKSQSAWTVWESNYTPQPFFIGCSFFWFFPLKLSFDSSSALFLKLYTSTLSFDFFLQLWIVQGSTLTFYPWYPLFVFNCTGPTDLTNFNNPQTRWSWCTFTPLYCSCLGRIITHGCSSQKNSISKRLCTKKGIIVKMVWLFGLGFLYSLFKPCLGHFQSTKKLVTT